MKKSPSKGKSNPPRIFRKLFKFYARKEERQMESSLKSDIVALKDQAENLKAVVNSLRLELENKDYKIANLAREKEKLSVELLNQQRSSHTLAQQLEDERSFHFQEKTMFCKEMNDYKKFKRQISRSNLVGLDERCIKEHKDENAKLRDTLHEVLVANYNLSIKYMRMKNTKAFLKDTLEKVQTANEQVVDYLKKRMDALSGQINEILSKNLRAHPVSPSSKKYLQVVHQNSTLLYQNLCLRQEIDFLSTKVQKLKLLINEKENRMQYKFMQPLHVDRPVRTAEKLERKDRKVIKLFERKKSKGVPNLMMMDGKDTPESKSYTQSSESKYSILRDLELTTSATSSGQLKRSRSAPKIVQSVSSSDLF